MRAILEFDLDSPEQREEHMLALRAQELVFAISEFANELRSKIKYDNSIPESELAVIENLRDRLWEILNERELSSLI